VVNAFIAKAEGFRAAWHVYTCDKAQGFKPDIHTFYALLGSCDEFADVLRVLAEMATWKASFDDDVIKQLIRVTGDPSPRQEHHHGGVERILREYVWRYAPDREKWIDSIFPPFKRV
jgi:hypothetical protein